MSIFNAMNTSASALTAQRLRMDIVSSNVANAETTRHRINEAGEWEPYTRKLVTFQSDPGTGGFKSYLNKANSKQNENVALRATVISESDEPYKPVFNPLHPDANAEGYVMMPNVDPLQEMVDLMSSTRSYEANVTTLNASKNMLMKALEIGK